MGLKREEIEKLFEFDKYKFQELLLNKNDSFEWWNDLNLFIIKSRVSAKVEIKAHETRVVRSRLGKKKVPVVRFVYDGISFNHPLQIDLIKSNNEKTYDDAFVLFQNGISQKSLATRTFNNAFTQPNLTKIFKKKYQENAM